MQQKVVVLENSLICLLVQFCDKNIYNYYTLGIVHQTTQEKQL